MRRRLFDADAEHWGIVKMDGKRQLKCPECERAGATTVVTYDPDDPMHRSTGALLRKTKPSEPLIIYLTCGRGHLERYEVG